jgi:hypothetical protein
MTDIVDRLRMYRVDLSVRIFAEAADEIEKLRAEVERLNLVLADVAYCDTPGEVDIYCVRAGGDMCPMYGWYDGPLCSVTGLYIGNDPRNP